MGQSIGGDEVHGHKYEWPGDNRGATFNFGVGRLTLSPEETIALLAAHRAAVLTDTTHVDLRGVPLPRAADGRRIDPHLPLERVYVRLRAVREERPRREEEARRREIERQADERDEAGLAGRLGDFFYADRTADRPDDSPIDPEVALREHGRMVILGPPGAGKSTLLRLLARWAAADADGPLPLRVSLGHYAAQLSRGDASLVDFALKDLPERQRAAVGAAIELGNVLWLLDALDEAREHAPRVLAQLAALPGQLVLTSRPLGYAPGSAADLPHFDLLPLKSGDADVFLTNWFGALAETQGYDEAWVVSRVKATRTRLDDRPGLRALLSNPLLLTFVAVLADRDPAEALPEHRAGLYRRYLEELLDSWEGTRRARAGAAEPAVGPLRGEAARAALRDGVLWLGWWLHLTYYGGRASRPPLEREAIEALAEYLLAAADYDDLRRHEARAAAGDVVAFWRGAGLLDVWQLRAAGGPADFLAFRHLTFQEYGAAVVLAGAWGAGRASTQRVAPDRERAWAFLRPRLHHRAWREPLLLLGGLLGAAEGDALLGAVLAAGSPYEAVLRRDLRAAVQMAQEVSGRNGPRKMEAIRMLAETIVARDATVPAWLNLLEDTLENSDLFVEPSIFALFLNALQDLEWNARWIAAGALGFSRNKAAVPVLIKCLQDADYDVRRSAAYSLGELRDMTAVPALIRLTDDEYPSVRVAALGALGQIDAEVASKIAWKKIEDEAHKVRFEVGLLLVLLQNELTIPKLMSLLVDGSERAREVAAHALGLLGERGAVPLLITTLKDPQFYVRFRALEALGRIQDEIVLPSLLESLHREEGSDRAYIVEALGTLNDRSIVAELSAYARDDNWYVRQKVAQALGRLADPTTLSTLLSMLEDANSYVRREVVIALGKLGDTNAEAALLRAMDWDRSSEVRCWATISIARLGNRSVVPKLFLVLKDSNRECRLAAAQTLGHLEEVEAVPTLLWALTDEEPQVRSACANAILGILDKLPVPVQALPGIANYLEQLMPVIDIEYDKGISDVFEHVASHLSRLNAAALPADDLLLPPTPPADSPLHKH